MSDSSPSNGQRPWENAPPMGIFRPLSPRLAAGQTASSGELLQPLGVRSLTILQPRLFLSNSKALALQPALSFEESPFFNTTEWRSPRLPQIAPSTLPPPPDMPMPVPPGPGLSSPTSDAIPPRLTAQTAQAVSAPWSVSPNREGVTDPAPPMTSDIQLTAAPESAAVTDRSDAMMRSSTSETAAPEPPTTPLNDVEGPPSSVEPVISSPTSTEFSANDLSTPLAENEPPASVAEPFTEPQLPAIQQPAELTSSTSKVDSTAIDTPVSNPPAESATRSSEFVQRSPSPSAPTSQLAGASGEVEVRPGLIEPTEEQFPLSPTEADVSANDDAQFAEVPSVAQSPSPPNSGEPTTTGTPMPAPSQPLGEGASEPKKFNETSISLIANEFSQASPSANGPDIQPQSVDPFPETGGAGEPLPTDFMPPLSEGSRTAAASDSPTAESQSPAPDLQRQPDSRDRLSSSTASDSAASSQAAVPTDQPSSLNSSSRLSEGSDTASSTASDIPKSSSPPEPPASRTTASLSTGEGGPIQPSPVNPQSPATPASRTASDIVRPTPASVESLDQPATSVPETTPAATEIQRSPTPPSPPQSSHSSTEATAAVSVPESLPASAMASAPIANQPEASASPIDGQPVAPASSSNPSTPWSDREASETAAQRPAMTDTSSTGNASTADRSSTTPDTPLNAPSLTESTDPVISSSSVDQPVATTSTLPSEASDQSLSLQRSLTDSTAQNPERVSSAKGASPTVPIENEVHTVAEAENAIPANQSPPIPGPTPPITKATESTFAALEAEAMSSTSQSPLDMATTADSLTPLEEPSDPGQRQAARPAEIGVSESSVDPEPRLPTSAEPQSLNASVSSPLDQGPEPTVPLAMPDSRQGLNSASEQSPEIEEVINPNQSSALGEAIQLTPLASDLPNAPAIPTEEPYSASLPEPEASVPETSVSGASEPPLSPPIPTNSSSAIASPRSPENTSSAAAAANSSETIDSPISDRREGVQRDTLNSAAPPEPTLPAYPADAPEAATPLPAGPTTSQSGATTTTKTTISAESITTTPADGVSMENAADLSQPFLVGDETIQRSVALPTVMTDLSHQTPLRSLQNLLSGDSEASTSQPTQPVPQSTASLADGQQRSPMPLPSIGGTDESAIVSADSEATVLQPSSQTTERRSHHHVIDDPGLLDPSPSTDSATIATPQAWDSIEDLLTQLPSSTPMAQGSAAIQRESVTAAAPETTFTNLQAAEIPTPVIQRRAATAPERPIQRLAAEPPPPDSTTAEYSVPETEELSSGTSENLEKLAGLMYQMVRQRFAIERERLGRSGSGRF